jgi:hypothetical protein
MNEKTQNWEQVRADEELLYRIDDRLRDSRLYRMREGITDTIRGVIRDTKPRQWLNLGIWVSVIGSLVGLWYAARNSRDMLTEKTWEKLNHQPAITCPEETVCDELQRIVDENKDMIQRVAERADVEPKELEALMAASYLNTHRRAKMAEGYRGTILMTPEDAGVSGSTLDDDLEQNLYTAALRYKNLLKESNFHEQAVCRFFTSEGECDNAVNESGDSGRQCNAKNFTKYVDVEIGECAAIEAHERHIDSYNEITEEMKSADWYRRSNLEEHRNTLPVLDPENLEFYKKAAHAMTWYHNLPDQYAQEAVPLFFAYLNAGIARQD